MGKNKNIDRREFMKLASLFTGTYFFSDPLLSFFANSTHSLALNAYAADLQIKSKKYLYFSAAGAPPRWVFDLFLNPNNDPGFAANPNIVNVYQDDGSGVYTKADAYKFYDFNGVHLPWIWSFQVPTPGGAPRPMTDLLPHMLSMRGVDALTPSHGAAESLHERYTAGQPSLGGLVADSVNSLVPAMSIDNIGLAFNSKLGKVAQPVFTDGNKTFDKNANVLNSALSSFVKTTNEPSSTIPVDKMMSAFSSTFKNYAPSMANDTKKAADQMRTGIADLSSSWTSLFTKYDNLTRAALNMRLPGVSDKPVGSSDVTTRGEEYRIDANGMLTKVTDLRDELNTSGVNPLNRMAQQFAVAEYMLKSGFGSFVNINLAAMTAIASNKVVTFDQHFTGNVTAVLINNHFYHGFATCLLELISSLDASGVWDSTVIHFTGEFGRIPKAPDANKNPVYGSDHAPNATNVSVWAKNISGLQIIGNTYLNKVGSSAYSGTYGLGAPLSELGGRSPNLGHVTSTIADLLGVPTPSTNNSSLIQIASGAAISKFGKTKSI